MAADSLWAPYVFVHEFGHHFAGLADEYYTSDVAYVPGAERLEPWEPNVTALNDPAKLKWKDLVRPGTPLPTPWRRTSSRRTPRTSRSGAAQIRAENRPGGGDGRALPRGADRRRRSSSAADSTPGKVGAFEGAMYEATRLLPAQVDCIMFTRDEVPFCAVCRRAIERVIELDSSPETPEGQ